MKKIILFVVFLGFQLSSFCQKIPLKVSSNYFFVNPETGKQVGITYDYIESNYDFENYIVCNGCSKNDNVSYSGGNWGLIDKYGTELIPLKYSKIEYFNHNILLYKDEKHGIANNRGEIVIPPVYSFLDVYELSNYYIGSNAFNLYGLISINGSVIIPFKYKQLILDNDYIIVESEKGKGLFNLNGEKILDEIYDDLDVLIVEKQLCVLVRIGSNSQLIDLKGNNLISNYKGMKPFTDLEGNLKGFWITSESLSGLISLRGDIIFPPLYEDINNVTINGSIYYILKKGKKYGVLDMNGKNTIPFSYDFIEKYQFGNNFIVSNDGEYTQLNDSDEKVFVPKSYKFLDINGKRTFNKEINKYDYQFYNGKDHLIYKSGGLWGIIDGEFNVQLPTEYSSISLRDFEYLIVSTGGVISNNDNYRETLEGGVWDILNLDYQKINTTSYDYIKETDSYPVKFIVKKSGLFGLMSLNGGDLIPCQYKDIECFNNGCLVSKIESDSQIEKVGFIDINSGEEIIPCIYDRLYKSNLTSNNFIAVKDNKFGVLDMLGNTLIDIKYDYLEGTFLDNYLMTNKGGEVTGRSVVGGEFGLINISGKEILKPEFKSFYLDKIDDFIVCRTSNDKTKIFDMKKMSFIELKGVEEIFVFNYGNFGIARNVIRNSDDEIVSALFGVMNSDYKTIIPMEYNSVTYYKEYFVVFDSISSTFELFNEKGGKILEKYQYIKSFDDSIVIFSKNGQSFNLFDAKNQKQIFEKDYAYIGIVNQNFIVQNEFSLKGIIALTGEIIIPFKYCDIQYIDVNEVMQYIVSACTETENKSVSKYGVITTSGNSIIPIEYESIIFDPLKNQYLCFSKNKQVIFDIYGDKID